MKTLIRFLCIVLTLSIVSCNKVIELDLRDTEIKYVIEGLITNEPGVCKVFLSKSKNFNEDNQFQYVSGAVVKVSDNGVEQVLPEVKKGVYETKTITGKPGHVYRLSVVVDNHTFTSITTMPEPVSMDTLYVSKGPFGQFNFPKVGYKDPATNNNNYRFVQYLNGAKEPTIFTEDDEFTDGQSVIVQLDNGADEKDDPRNIKTGDQVTVEMLCLDDAVYKFWKTLGGGGGDGDGNTAAPANPITNIQGGAIGYFSAHTVNRKTVIAP